MEAAILSGSECLASSHLGWQGVIGRLNEAQYQALKRLVSSGRELLLGTGGHARLLATLNVPVRLGLRWAQRVCTARARLLILPCPNAVEQVVRASGKVTGAHVAGPRRQPGAGVAG